MLHQWREIARTVSTVVKSNVLSKVNSVPIWSPAVDVGIVVLLTYGRNWCRSRSIRIRLVSDSPYLFEDEIRF